MHIRQPAFRPATLKLLVAICFAATLPDAELPATERQPKDRPNILIILADDMGYSDAGCYGGEISTPNLDSLAKGGLRFTQCYNTARCWPSRAVIMTGYYAQQIRRDAHYATERGSGQGQRPEWAPLLPQMLKPLGYRAYHSGKWHIDGKQLINGFDRSYSLDDHDRYFNPQKHTLDDKPLPAIAPGSDHETHPGVNQEGRGERLFKEDGKPSEFTDQVLKFLQEYQTQFERTRMFGRRLKELDLLEPMQAEVTTPSGEKMKLTGFHTVSREKLKALSSDVLTSLVKSDILELIYLHLYSIRNFASVKDRLASSLATA